MARTKKYEFVGKPEIRMDLPEERARTILSQIVNNYTLELGSSK